MAVAVVAAVVSGDSIVERRSRVFNFRAVGIRSRRTRLALRRGNPVTVGADITSRLAGTWDPNY